MAATVDFSHHISSRTVVDDIRCSLEGLGFNEVVANSLIDENVAKLFSDNIVQIKNPISKDLSAMRPSLVCSMLQTVFYNSNYGTNDIRAFEIGRTYKKVDKPTGVLLFEVFWKKRPFRFAFQAGKIRLDGIPMTGW